MQPVQDLTVDDRVSRTQYQYTIEDPNQTELNQVSKDFVNRLQQLPQLADVVTDQSDSAACRPAGHRPRHRLALRRHAVTTIDNTLYDAFGQRQINTMYTQVNQYHVILETLPSFQQHPQLAERHLRPVHHQVGSGSSAPAARPEAAGSSSGAGAGGATSSGNAAS